MEEEEVEVAVVEQLEVHYLYSAWMDSMVELVE
jgi:hypothetical protein